ncbi:helix-turn-helix domain-containing protein [Chitinophaga filiformis]|uniref:ATP-binding protein n=1 Tax=Chitinophaga filiformis TaxID=104663 RepID=A0ABY4HY65_CHIFI|nr:ATP-binding protein [Chitinophaga filiformis]UPK68079.1 ATP-binding protein [Chitinophaga filiformis]
MILFDKKVEDFDQAFIQLLIDDKVPESRTLDYKLKVDITRDDSKEELLNDICSFYNTEGGIMIFGLDELRDGKKKLGIPAIPATNAIEIADYPQFQSRLRSALQSGTDPSIIGIRFSPLIKIDGIFVFAVGIPKCSSMLSMVTFNGSHRFFRRNESDKYRPRTYELFTALTTFGHLKQQIERYTESRVLTFPATFAHDLEGRPGALVHIVPTTFLETASIPAFTSKDFVKQAVGLFPSQGRYISTKFGYNIDGLTLLHINEDNAPIRGERGSNLDAYTVLLRNGAIENFSSIFVAINPGSSPELYLEGLVTFIVETIKSAFKYYAFVKIATEFYVSVRLINLGAHAHLIKDSGSGELRQPELKMPIVFITDEETATGSFSLLFDILWQAIGDRGCPDLLKEKYLSAGWLYKE